ncbi:MMPL family transporter [uncultured Brevibacterium sp.]|uniref:MMPL family transporter n=1 Tax=uncultured Brevibacterium sp. TaxID=189678 RepID=UPI0025F2CB3E|nr:MMPL family transporter [uncultured Brevibacterium sp.]
MTTSTNTQSFADRLTSRRGAWITLGVSLLILVALFGVFGKAKAPVGTNLAPADSESMQTAELMKKFPEADRGTILVVATRDDGAELTEDQLAQLKDLLPVLDDHLGAESNGPLPSEDKKAALLVTGMQVSDASTENAEVVNGLRATLADHVPTGMSLQVTGGPAFGADVAGAFDGANFLLLSITIGIVAVLLILTYRSPILWLLPLFAVGMADGLAGRVTAAAGAAWDLQFDAGIISVLVFGAGTNYALLLISRYREELLRTPNHRTALSNAWRGTVPAILASNFTVVLALLILVVAAIPSTRGIGIASAIGLVIALAAVLFLLPPLLAVSGRKAFWPFIPKPEQNATTPDTPATTSGGAHATTQKRSFWRWVASNVVRKPAVSLLAGLALLGVMATGLLGTSVGLDQIEKFRVKSESATGFEVLSQHYAPGEAQPIWVVANTDKAQDVVDEVETVEGIVRAHTVAETDDGTLTKVMVTSEYAPSTAESLAQIRDLREAVHGVSDAEAVVGGAVAEDLDARDGNKRDLFLIAPLILGVCFVVLLVLLRSIVAPVLLLLVNLTSTVAAIGAGAWLSRVFLGQQALDLQVPLLAFLFLVALGIDYTIFLVHRARNEAKVHGTRDGVVEAITHTGGVITSAGVVLAAVFAALGILPLVTLGQLGLIVGVGVIVDTLVVRAVIVPSIFTLMGDKIWWPSKAPNASAR